ncbi:MAG: ABC transporter ATP-binding protein [Vicinamibacterales bacterium]
MADIRLRALEKRWGAVTGVHSLDLTVHDGELFVLLGPSGCGKTTTMRMIAGLDEPTAGEIWIGGRRVDQMPPRDRDIAMVFQNYGLYPHRTVFGNIAFPLEMRRTPRQEIDERVRTAAARVELTELLERRPAQLSGGQRQRVALARAIVRRPQVFLMDEPLSNLDAKLRLSTRAEIRQLQRDLAATTVYVTHDQVEAMTLADRIAMMDRGRLQQVGTPDQIYNDPSNLFVAGFIGSPPMNLIRGRIEGGMFRSASITAVTPHGVADGDAVIGVRPEDVQLVAGADAPGAGVVTSSEYTGTDVFVAVAAGEAAITSRAERHERFAAGTPVSLTFSPERLYFFHPATGARLRAAA